jgi:hypothetical protein
VWPPAQIALWRQIVVLFSDSASFGGGEFERKFTQGLRPSVMLNMSAIVRKLCAILVCLVFVRVS